MDSKQIKIISWIYNMCKIDLLKDQEHGENDVRLLTEAILRRFPSEYEEIIKFPTIEEEESQ